MTKLYKFNLEKDVVIGQYSIKETNNSSNNVDLDTIKRYIRIYNKISNCWQDVLLKNVVELPLDIRQNIGKRLYYSPKTSAGKRMYRLIYVDSAKYLIGGVRYTLINALGKYTQVDLSELNRMKSLGTLY